MESVTYCKEGAGQGDRKGEGGGEGKEKEVDLAEVTFRRGTKRRWRQEKEKLRSRSH